MTKEEITNLAMRDANTETAENLRAAAAIYQTLINNQSSKNQSSKNQSSKNQSSKPGTPGTHAPQKPARPQG